MSPGLAIRNWIEQKQTAADPAMDWLALEFPWAVSEIYTARAQITERERLFRMAPADFALVMPASEATVYSIVSDPMVKVNVSVDTKGLSTSLEDVMALLKKQFGQDVDVFRAVDDELAYRIEVQTLGPRPASDPAVAYGIQVATDYFHAHVASPFADNPNMTAAEFERQLFNAKPSTERQPLRSEPEFKWQTILPDPDPFWEKIRTLQYMDGTADLRPEEHVHISDYGGVPFVDESSPFPESQPRQLRPLKKHETRFVRFTPLDLNDFPPKQGIYGPSEIEQALPVLDRYSRLIGSRRYAFDDGLKRAIEEQQRHLNEEMTRRLTALVAILFPSPASTGDIVPAPEGEESVAHLPVEQRLAYVMNEVHRRFNADVISREVYIKWRRLHFPKILIRVASVHSMAMHCLFHRCDIKHDAVMRLDADFDLDNDGTLPLPEPHEVWQVWDERSTHTDYRCAQVCSIDQRLKAKETDDQLGLGDPASIFSPAA